MAALSRGNTQLITHIMEVHAGAVSELSGSSCFEVYCSTRESLIEPLVTGELESYLSSEETLESRIRSAILFTIEVCERESEEYLNFFCSEVSEKQLVTTVRSSPAFNSAVRYE